ncbi:MAG: DNA primase [Rhabdochlamydiaceae bacterium]
MPIYKKESLDHLKSKIDLVEILSSHMPLHKGGSSYKGLCPFHEEKTPSFTIQKGDKYYHCYGCGAHGDAISFLMSYVKLSFTEAVEYLAEKFHVVLEEDDHLDQKQISKTALKEVLNQASLLFHFLLLYSAEAEEFLTYLYNRGIDIDFIKAFQIGYAPKDPYLIGRLLEKMGFKELLLEEAGLLNVYNDYGKRKSFFIERIMFPVRDIHGAVIGFSARKIKDQAKGGKYVNSPETLLFKKSQILFGLSYSRSKITKQKEAIIVEGQLDALRLIHAGFNYTVASQGTAFGEIHAKELINLGVNKVYLCMDGDVAGREATVKVGHIFQKKGIDVFVIDLGEDMDPDLFVREKGPDVFREKLMAATDYLSFVFGYYSLKIGVNTPSQKNQCIQMIAEKIREWEHEVMIHESLKKLASLAHIPESSLGVGQRIAFPQPLVKKQRILEGFQVDADKIIEMDVLRWLFMTWDTHPLFRKAAVKHLSSDSFKNSQALYFFDLFYKLLEKEGDLDLFSIGANCESAEHHKFLSEMMQKKIPLQKAEECFLEALQKLLERNWWEKTEEIRLKLCEVNCSEEEAISLAKQFDEIKRSPPLVIL